MRKILVLSLSLQPPSGGNGVGAWTVQALCHDYDVTVLTWETFSAAPIDRYFGTNLGAARLQAISAPLWLQWLLLAVPLRLVHIEMNCILRMLRQRAHQFDLLICTHNEVDLGRAGVQYIHDSGDYVSAKWRTPPLRYLLEGYRWLCRRISGFRPAGIRDNLTLTNSRFMARRVTERYGLRARVLHPPVTGVTQAFSWSERTKEFICLGRIVRSKEVDKVIRILDRVRSRGHQVRLHLVGNADDRRYFREIMRMVRVRSHWIEFHDRVARGSLAELISRCRYGLHGMTEEHFGMAVAEMVRGGCVVFVPNGGGQIDIVGDARLIYQDEEDAAAKIVAVLESPALQEELRGKLQTQASMFSEERFMQEMREVARQCLGAVQPPMH